MGEPYHLIEDKCSRAFKAAIETALDGDLTGWSVYQMLQDSSVTHPMIGVRVDEASIPADRSGNYAALVEVAVVSKITETTTAAHNTIVAKVRDFLVGCMDDLPALVNAEAITDFNVIGWNPESVTTEVDDDDNAEFRISSCSGTCLCMPSTP